MVSDRDTAGIRLARGNYIRAGAFVCFVWLLYFVAGLHGSRGVAVRWVCGLFSGAVDWNIAAGEP